MKFKIRYADQIVGLLTLLAAIALVAVIILIGGKQRWFADDYHFYTDFDSGSGLNVGMAVQYKGFTIGKVKSITLDKKSHQDNVRVYFNIYENYNDWLYEGSVVELNISPIGLGNQFLFYPGTGSKPLANGAFIPLTDSPEGKAYVEKGLVVVPKKDDTISNILAQANKILTNTASVTGRVDDALAGKGNAPLTNMIHSVEKTSDNVSVITGVISRDLSQITSNIKELTTALSAAANAPEGAVPALLDPNGQIFPKISDTLEHTSATIANLEKATAALPSQFPQISSLINEIQIALQDAEDVMEALKNNPILKNGVPERVNTDTSGTNPRNLEF